ncbi:MAG TPA: DUF167 domain-containing protein [Pyrinomonadaceae bacterium]|nr:DUF167 domain-containing protein [Pyrinomonadaceae bacterium]
MIECLEGEGSITFRVRVVPRASRSQIIGEHDGALRVRVNAPPVDGAANGELVRTLAREFNVSVRDVEITGGHTTRLKRVRVRGAATSALEKLCEPRRGETV